MQLKWNKLGSSLIVLAQTDVDKSNRSYYGETNMYILSASGGFDSRVHLGTHHSTISITSSDRLSLSPADMPCRQRGSNSRRHMVSRLEGIWSGLRLHAGEDDYIQYSSKSCPRFQSWTKEYDFIFSQRALCARCWFWQLSWTN